MNGNSWSFVHKADVVVASCCQEVSRLRCGDVFISRFKVGDRLLANEFAPRVHNSGHWTEAACHVCQFEQHVRAVAGWPLGDTRRNSDCVMENLLGDEIFACRELAALPGTVVHDYGKATSRDGRKMGHVTRLNLKK